MPPAHTSTPPELPDLADFCRKWRISKLELFGSALRDDFGPHSDIDLLYSFSPDAKVSYFDLDDMEHELSSLVGRKVDLVSRAAIERSRNWYRRQHILSSTRVLYAALACQNRWRLSGRYRYRRGQRHSVLRGDKHRGVHRR